jgi:hypothetical protein
MMLGDGAWLALSPVAAALFTVGAFGAGFFFGGFRNDAYETYSYSLLLLGILFAIANLGAAVGLLAWLGYVAGDLLLFDHGLGFAGDESHLTRGLVPLLITYGWLAVPMVLGPAAATAARTLLVLRLQSLPAAVRVVGGALLQGAVAWCITWAWVRSMPVLIRPPWQFANAGQPTEPFAQLQVRGLRLVWVAAAVAGLRGAVGGAIERGLILGPPKPAPDGAAVAPPRPAARRLALQVAGVVVVSGLVTLLLAGLLATKADVALCWGALAGSLALRKIILPAVPGYARALNKIPVLLRVAACLVVARVAGGEVLDRAYERNDLASLRPLLVAVAVSLLLSALLLPRRSPQEADG